MAPLPVRNTHKCLSLALALIMVILVIHSGQTDTGQLDSIQDLQTARTPSRASVNKTWPTWSRAQPARIALGEIWLKTSSCY